MKNNNELKYFSWNSFKYLYKNIKRFMIYWSNFRFRKFKIKIGSYLEIKLMKKQRNNYLIKKK